MWAAATMEVGVLLGSKTGKHLTFREALPRDRQGESCAPALQSTLCWQAMLPAEAFCGDPQGVLGPQRKRVQVLQPCQVSGRGGFCGACQDRTTPSWT